MPEKIGKKLYTSILPQWKTCFIAALLVGLVAHIYKITNWLPNWDSIVFRYNAQNMVGLGRWFLPVVTAPSSFYELPFLNGIIAILFHAAAAVCICSMLGVQKKITAAIIGAFIASFPTVTSVMMYSYVADGYSIAFFLSTLAAVLLTKEKPKVLLASVLIALSTGIYQAYLTVTIMLLLLHLIGELLFKKAMPGALLKKALQMLLSGVLGMVLYAVILKITLAVFSMELLDYQGANATASLSSINLPASLYVIRETFRKFFFDFSGGVNVYLVLNALVVLFTLLYYLGFIIKNKVYKKPGTLLLLIFLSIMLIPGAAALAFMNGEMDYHNLMLMGYAVFYLFFFILYEREGEGKKEIARCWVVLALAAAIISNQVVIANVSYHKAQMAYEKSYGTLVRIADRIEQTPLAEACDKIVVLGALENSEAYSATLPPEITGITDGYILRADDETVGQSILSSALVDYCGKNYQFVSGEEKKAMAAREEVKAMGVWPQANCVAVIENTIIIKLSAEGEE